MARPLHEIEEEIRSSKTADKDQLLRALLADIDGETEQDAEAVWLKEAQRRYQELRDGSVRAVPADEVIKRARSRLIDGG